MEGNVKGSRELKGSKELVEEVINAGLCTLCGACAGSCPYLVSFKGKIVHMDNCTLEEGQCYQYCPRTYLDMDEISQKIFGTPYSEDGFGTTKEVLIARSTSSSIRNTAQYGGYVTTLMSLAMEEGLIDSAVLTKTDDDKAPKAVLAKNTDEVLQCAGSNYMACSVLEVLNKIPEDSDQKVGLVGTPCQVLAISKMKNRPPKNRANIANTRLVIGLFCTWALSQREFYGFLKENLNLPKVKKFDIPPPPANIFEAYTDTGKTQFGLDQVRAFAMPTCAYCLDMTSEFADISVGAVEGIEGWNTVIIRTDVGKQLIEMAKKQDKIETNTLPVENLAHLKEASLLKKKRALNEIVRRTGDKRNLLYLNLSPKCVEKLLD
jgi:coenzyme F420 hydrogenase subunit beta